MAGKYTDAQHRAISEYRKDKSTISITLTNAEKQLVQENAERAQLSLKKYIMGLVEMDRMREEN